MLILNTTVWKATKSNKTLCTCCVCACARMCVCVYGAHAFWRFLWRRLLGEVAMACGTGLSLRCTLLVLLLWEMPNKDNEPSCIMSWRPSHISEIGTVSNSQRRVIYDRKRDTLCSLMYVHIYVNTIIVEFCSHCVSTVYHPTYALGDTSFVTFANYYMFRHRGSFLRESL